MTTNAIPPRAAPTMGPMSVSERRPVVLEASVDDVTDVAGAAEEGVIETRSAEEAGGVANEEEDEAVVWGCEFVGGG